MKKKIGVFTLGNAKENYGQILQAYALQTFLRHQGYDPFLINYRRTFYLSDEKSLRKIVKALYLYLKGLVRKEETKIEEKQSVKLRNFSGFYKENFKLSKLYTSIDDLVQSPPDADVYITGSDQIWNWDSRYGYEKAAFLQFGNDKITKLSYAAGMSRIVDKPKVIKELSVYLSKLNYISLREDTGIPIINKAGYSKVNVVCDPTLLLDVSDYQNIMKSPKLFVKKAYSLGYLINIKSNKDVQWDNVKEYIKNQNLDFIYTSSEGYVEAIDNFDEYENNYFTVPEWLYVMANSENVFTTSYHGLLFSLIFKKPFIFYFADIGHSYGRNRINFILSKVGLEDRVFDEEKNNCVETIMNRPIDWNIVKKRLDDFRKESIKYLVDAID